MKSNQEIANDLMVFGGIGTLVIIAIEALAILPGSSELGIGVQLGIVVGGLVVSASFIASAVIRLRGAPGRGASNENKVHL